VLIIGAQDNGPGSRDEMIRPLMEANAAIEAINATTVMLPGDHSFSWSREALINTVADRAQIGRRVAASSARYRPSGFRD
jgi:hypothetical protein